jgi:hypothetical protein
MATAIAVVEVGVKQLHAGVPVGPRALRFTPFACGR